ncbi:MAG: ABC transporter ATP-binding protein [Thermoplasmata archaeon]|nr:MAG: ABC transporter ATP-binding protein [Thermoplasmata archaeon]
MSVKDLDKYFGDFQALADINIAIQPREFYGCFGPNGAGKTTLLKILTGQLDYNGGKVNVSGLAVKNSPLEVKRRIGIVPEFESPPSFLTAQEYLYFVGHVREVNDIETKVKNWMDFFDLWERGDVLCRDLSKGTRQKLMIAAAVIHQPKLLFLDEPFINLDPIYQKKVQKYLLDYIKSGGTIFMCTHLLEIAEKLCTRIAILDHGRIVGEGDINSLRKKPKEDLSDIFMRLVQSR